MVLVSRDGHATLIQIVMSDEPTATSVDRMIATVERANGQGGFAVHVTGKKTIDHDFTRISESDLRQGEMQFGLPAALIVLVLVFGTLVGAAIPVTIAVLSIVVPWAWSRRWGLRGALVSLRLPSRCSSRRASASGV